jgi:hypothetical protein
MTGNDGTGQCHVRLRTELEIARAVGLPFSQAWPAAVSSALGEARWDIEKRAWQEAFASTRTAWESSYDMVPSDTTATAMMTLGLE